MPLPDVTLIFKDGALGILPAETDQIQLVLGASSDGPINVLTPITEKEQLGGFGFGPLVQCSALKLEIGGGPIYVMRVVQSDGSVSAVTASGAAPPAVSVVGKPLDAIDGRVRVTYPGALGTARFVYSLDGGQTYSVEAATAATFPIRDTGLMLTFPAGAYDVDNTYTFTATPPQYAISALNDAFDSALRDKREWGIVHIIGAPNGATDIDRATACSALAAAVQSKMSAAENVYRYARAVLEAPNVSDDALLAAFANFVGPRVAVVAGYGTTLSPLDGTLKLRSDAWVVLAQIMKKPIGKDPAQVEVEDGTGPLPASLTSIARDERVTPSLDAARFTTVRTHIGLDGFYVTNFRLMSAAGSDLVYLQHGQVLDHACKVVRGVLLKYLGRDLELNPNGTLDEGAAQSIEEKIVEALRAELVAPGHVSAVVARANRTDDVLSTQKLRGSFGIQPKFYPKFIEFEFGFTKTVPAAA